MSDSTPLFHLIAVCDDKATTLVITDDMNVVTREMSSAVGRGGWSIHDLVLETWRNGTMVAREQRAASAL